MKRTRKSAPSDVEPDEAPPLEEAPAPRPLRPWLVQMALPLLAGAALLGAVVFLGGRAREELRQRGRYDTQFADVEVDPPPGLTREELLGEVQYLSGWPDRFDPRDGDTCARLGRAFAAHPWVEEVQRVEKKAGHLRVELVHRVPVLNVQFGGARRAVDRHGVLLPAAAATADRPRLVGPVAPPSGRPGSAWGDKNVEAAASTLHVLAPHLERLRLRPCTVVVVAGNVVLSGPHGRIVWGAAPGREGGEAGVEEKVRRLLAGPGVEGQEVDVRPAEGARRRAL